MIHNLLGQKRWHIALGIMVILMMESIIFSQLAMEIYAYSFIATQKMNNIEQKREKSTQQNNKSTGENLQESETVVNNVDTTGAVVLMMPVKNGITTSVFGDKVSRNAVHLGHDWAVSIGTSVRASADGVVESAYYSESYGYNILLYHRDGIETRYAHLSQLQVEKGQTVSKNEVIGLSGNTGDSTGPHLHFEVIKNGEHINPLEIIGR
jgi:murein DD-endopeptidase MepM/ murein hydrolase activator NlpD